MARRLILRALALLLSFAVMVATASAPASAHKGHKKKQEQAAQQARNQASPGAETSASMQRGPTAMHAQMGEMMDEEPEDRSNMGLLARLLDWLGRTHPVIVHFPIAFFPAALFTAVVGRRRPGFAAPVQFLVVAGGIIAPIAAIFGWLDAMNAEPDPMLTVHRWLGTGIGVAAFALAVWAWHRPGQDRSVGMIVALAAITVAIIVQGWFGGAMVHGMDHMNW